MVTLKTHADLQLKAMAVERQELEKGKTFVRLNLQTLADEREQLKKLNVDMVGGTIETASHHGTAGDLIRRSSRTSWRKTLQRR